MKLKKIITMGLAAVMAVSAMSISAFAADTDSEVVYSYADENNNIVNVTQADLDAGHWDKEALGDTAPAIYENFPMSMTGFTNDFAELSLDFIYMKNIDDMDSVHLKITDLLNDSVIYDDDIVQQSFYSPILQENGQYEVKVTETVEGIVNEYSRVVFVNKTIAEMPEYVTNPSEDDNSIILIADINTLRQGQSVDENGKIVVNSSVASYDRIPANEFAEYCNLLPDNNIYRVFAFQDGKQYGGFFSKNNGNEIYDLSIDSYTWEDINTTAMLSLPTNVTIDNVMSKATEVRIADNCFRLKESSASGKYAAFYVYLPDSYVGSTAPTAKFKVTVTGTSQVAMKVWSDTKKNSTPTAMRTYTSSNNTNSVSMDVSTSNYKNTADYISFYIMVYFPSAVDGYGMINVEPVEGVNEYTDDVTGSIYNAYNGSSAYADLENTQFSLTDSWDIDAFAIDYWGTDSIVYKIELKNRSLSDQSSIENGVYKQGSPAKNITTWDITDQNNVAQWNPDNTYTVPKNTDMVIYCDPTYIGEKVITIQNESTGSTKTNYYQLSYHPI